MPLLYSTQGGAGTWNLSGTYRTGVGKWKVVFGCGFGPECPYARSEGGRRGCDRAGAGLGRPAAPSFQLPAHSATSSSSSSSSSASQAAAD